MSPKATKVKSFISLQTNNHILREKKKLKTVKLKINTNNFKKSQRQYKYIHVSMVKASNHSKEIMQFRMLGRQAVASFI